MQNRASPLTRSATAFVVVGTLWLALGCSLGDKCFDGLSIVTADVDGEDWMAKANEFCAARGLGTIHTVTGHQTSVEGPEGVIEEICCNRNGIF